MDAKNSKFCKLTGKNAVVSVCVCVCVWAGVGCVPKVI